MRLGKEKLKKWLYSSLMIPEEEAFIGDASFSRSKP